MVSDARRHAVMVPPWVRDALWSRARAVPSLDLDFAGSRSLVDRISGQQLITFTRASSATVIGPTGAIETVGNDVPRFQHDPATGRCLGLLVEEQRQNLLLNSATLSTQSVTSAATAYTLSFYGTGTITLTGTSTAGPLVGTGANARVSLTFTPTAGTLTLTVSGSVTNANLEAGSFATSWIPTTGTAATRSADVATITGSNFSRWYRQDEGSVYWEGTRNRTTGFPERFSLNDGTANNRIFSYFDAAANSSTFTVVTSSVNQGDIFGGGGALNSNLKTGFGFALNNVSAIYSGGVQNTDTTVTLPIVNQLVIGNGLGGTISRLTYWPQRLPNATLQTITS